MKIKIYFNNCNWQSIPEKIQSIKDFFSPKFQFEIDYIHTNFTNIPFVTVQGSDGSSGTEMTTNTEVVDPIWYDKNITSNSLGYDIVIFFLSDSDKTGHVTSQGIRQDNDEGPIEITIFGGKETDHVYNQGIDMGNNFAFFCCHEITHALFMIQGGTDDTHKYFYGLNPKQALNGISPTVSKLSPLIRLAKYLGKLMGLYKQKEILDSYQEVKQAIMISAISQKVYDTAYSLLGKYITMNTAISKNLNCAQSVSYVLNKAGLPIPKGGISGTVMLNEWLKVNAKVIDEPGVGDIVISITEGDNHGHVGIMGKNSIMSNDSVTGLFKPYYTLKSWTEFYVNTKKLKTIYYRICG